MPITLQIGATTKTLTAWGVRSAVLRYVSLADDTLALTFHPPGDALTLPSWSYGDTVRVFDTAGTCRFAGRVLAPGVGRAMRQDRLALIAAGPWHQLAAIDYTQDGHAWTPGYYDTATPPVYHAPELITYPESHVSLFWQAATAGAVERGSLTPQAVLIDALTKAAGCCQYGSCSITAPVPVEETYDLKLADVIRRCTRFAPDAVGWFDYTTTPPTFHLGTRRAIGAVSFSAADSRIAEINLDPRPDLQVQGVIFRYASSEPQATAGASWLKTVDLGTDYAGDPFSDPSRVVSHTFEIAANATEKLPIPLGLAAEYYFATLELPWQGSIELHEFVPTFAFSPGQRLNITDAATALATASALVQEAEYDLVSGHSRCTLGPPEHLQPTDIESLTRSLRDVGATTYPLTQGTETAQETPDSAAAQAATAQATAGDGTAPADTLTQRIQDKLGSFALQAGSGFQVSIKSLTATLCGQQGFVATTPPNFYLRDMTTILAHWGCQGVKVSTGSSASTRLYDPAAGCTYTDTTSSTGYALGCISGSWEGASYTDTTADLFAEWSGNGIGCPCPSQIPGEVGDRTLARRLTQQDTDALALERAKALASWSAWADYNTTINAGTPTWQTVRTEGRMTTAKATKIRGTLRSNIYGYSLRVSVPLYRYPIDGVKPSTPTSTQVWDLYLVDTLENIADAGHEAVWVHTGVATLPEWEVPVEQGYITLADTPKVELP